MIRAKDWSHGHSIGTGVLGGLLLARRPEIVFVLGVATGVAVMYTRNIAHWLALVLEGSRRRFAQRLAKKQIVRVPRDDIPF